MIYGCLRDAYYMAWGSVWSHISPINQMVPSLCSQLKLLSLRWIELREMILREVTLRTFFHINLHIL